MEFETPNKQTLVRLVRKCLSENSEGFIERDQFVDFCSELSVSTDELDSVFNELDSDKDGRISVSDFTTGYENVATCKSHRSDETVNGVIGSFDKSLYECQVSSLESPMQVISTSGQQYISELYYNLTNSNQPDLLDLFEKHLASVVKEIKAKAGENQRLEDALKRATKQHARQVSNLDREVEQQMEKLETKIRQEEKSSYEKKLSDFEWQLEGKEKEISAMNKTIETLQTRLDKETSKPNTRREEFENVAQENRYLKSQVTDSQTTLALLRSELAELKSQFVEQSDQLQKEQNRAEGCVQEYDNLTRQLQLLHEANQRLQDVNDELRGALETKKNSAPERKISSEVLRMSGVFPDPIVNHGLSSSLRSNTFPRSKSATPPLGSRHAEYHGADFNDNTFNEDSLFSEIHRASTPYKSDSIDEDDDEAYGTMSKSKKAQVQRQIQILEDTNKRLGSSNDELRVALKMMARSGSFRKPKKTSSGSRRPHSFHSDYSSLSSNRSSRSLSPKQKRLSNGDIGEATDESTTYDVEEEENVGTDSTATMNSETIAELETQFKKITESKDEEKDTKSDLDDDDDEDGMDSTELAELVAMASDLTDVTDSESETGRSSSGNRTGEISTMTEMNGSPSYATPERMYKLVLAGDAAVGKSSFILRLCKNKFHSSLNATLGVDFQVKNLKVDSKTVALQLWDTAGQERFRSIAKSYFRKVDGVLLLYDVTCEASFVNIRDWMSTIEESSQKKVPIMLCGNKCDLRDEFLMEGKKVISTESGQRLAKHYDALFIETSAKDGSRIEEACKELARVLTSLENEEIEQSGLRLEKPEKEKKKRPCCPS
ncbi:ras and EF-hand domain-containing protein-like isoform X2 [Dendronephthya gigantea]|uniref:ras and EF-hand domain-containing protein-like isoform X2 n=1 Tax=Dendronephthya gigantea TaxID=151771 RepID=UPI00106D71E4|nr:ras and EF-hand domain-containing protein-like isoform X2 [Dendronephthya gigantea]